MVETDFLNLYLYAFVFGVVAGIMYDVLWVIRVSFLGKRLVWLTDLLATSSAGIFISVLQYNFSSGRFRIMPFVIFPAGVLLVRLTFSRVFRRIMNKIIDTSRKACLGAKIGISSKIRRGYVLRASGNGFGLLKKNAYKSL